MTDFGEELRRLLAERGISLSAAAREAGCSKGYLSNAVHGRKQLTPKVAAGLDRVFGTSGTFIAYALQSSSGVTSPRKARPSFAASPGDSASHDCMAENPEDPAEKERLDYALTHPASADLVTAARIRERIRRLDEKYDRSPAAALIAETGQYLGQVGFLGAHVRRGDVRRDLCAAEAEAATLMGQLVWDASQRRDHATALAYYDQAVTAARSRGDRTAEGLALLRTSMVALYGQKEPRAGLEACERATDVAAKTSGVITGLAVLHTAEAHAMLGDRRSCEQALAAADGHLTKTSQDDPAIELFSPGQPGRMAGSCYLFLSDARRAALILEEETRRHLRYHSKAEAIVLGNLALAYIGQSRVDEAVAALHKAVDVIELTWGGGGLNVVFTAGRQLRRWQQTSLVREVCDRLLALMAADHESPP